MLGEEIGERGGVGGRMRGSDLGEGDSGDLLFRGGLTRGEILDDAGLLELRWRGRIAEVADLCCNRGGEKLPEERFWEAFRERGGGFFRWKSWELDRARCKEQ